MCNSFSPIITKKITASWDRYTWLLKNHSWTYEKWIIPKVLNVSQVMIPHHPPPKIHQEDGNMFNFWNEKSIPLKSQTNKNWTENPIKNSSFETTFNGKQTFSVKLNLSDVPFIIISDFYFFKANFLKNPPCKSSTASKVMWDLAFIRMKLFYYITF